MLGSVLQMGAAQLLADARAGEGSSPLDGSQLTLFFAAAAISLGWVAVLGVAAGLLWQSDDRLHRNYAEHLRFRALNLVQARWRIGALLLGLAVGLIWLLVISRPFTQRLWIGLAGIATVTCLALGERHQERRVVARASHGAPSPPGAPSAAARIPWHRPRPYCWMGWTTAVTAALALVAIGHQAWLASSGRHRGAPGHGFAHHEITHPCPEYLGQLPWPSPSDSVALIGLLLVMLTIGHWSIWGVVTKPRLNPDFLAPELDTRRRLRAVGAVQAVLSLFCGLALATASQEILGYAQLCQSTSTLTWISLNSLIATAVLLVLAALLLALLPLPWRVNEHRPLPAQGEHSIRPDLEESR